MLAEEERGKRQAVRACLLSFVLHLLGKPLELLLAGMLGELFRYLRVVDKEVRLLAFTAKRNGNRPPSYGRIYL